MIVVFFSYTPLSLFNVDKKILTVATINVNGIRAAYKKGMQQWLETQKIDILCLQEVRAPNTILQQLLTNKWNIVHEESTIKGRAGVAIAALQKPHTTRTGLGLTGDTHTGRWVEADFTTNSGKNLTVVSAYVHSGEAGTSKQEAKYVFLNKMLSRLPQLQQHTPYALVVGDLNVGHTTLDIKNWKGNLKRSGFLPEERAYFDKIFTEMSWVDLGRKFFGETPGPYTWWSNRGQAFTNDTGWRIDYQLGTEELAQTVTNVTVGRAESYEQRFSDHAPVIVDYLI